MKLYGDLLLSLLRKIKRLTFFESVRENLPSKRAMAAVICVLASLTAEFEERIALELLEKIVKIGGEWR